MTSTTIGGTNGRQRKSLEHQLDRLDSILDCIAEGLNGAVADAVKDAVGVAVKEAVQAVLAEVLTNPAVAKKLAEAGGLASEPRPTYNPKPTWRERLAAGWRAVRSAMVAAKHKVPAKVKNAVGFAARVVTGIRTAVKQRARGVVALAVGAAVVSGLTRWSVVKAVGVGLVVGVGCYVAGPEIAGCVSGLGGAALAVGWRLVQPVLPLIRLAAGEDEAG